MQLVQPPSVETVSLLRGTVNRICTGTTVRWDERRMDHLPEKGRLQEPFIQGSRKTYSSHRLSHVCEVQATLFELRSTFDFRYRADGNLIATRNSCQRTSTGCSKFELQDSISQSSYTAKRTWLQTDFFVIGRSITENERNNVSA